MYYSPHTHLALARARQEDLIREAEHRRLVASFKDDRPSALARLRHVVSGLASARKHPAPAAS